MCWVLSQFKYPEKSCQLADWSGTERAPLAAVNVFRRRANKKASARLAFSSF